MTRELGAPQARLFVCQALVPETVTHLMPLSDVQNRICPPGLLSNLPFFAKGWRVTTCDSSASWCIDWHRAQVSVSKTANPPILIMLDAASSHKHATLLHSAGTPTMNTSTQNMSSSML